MAISEHTRQLLREAAIRNGLGGKNRYKNRKKFSNKKLLEITQFVLSNHPKWISPFNNKDYKKKAAWVNHMAHYITERHLRKLIFYIEEQTCGSKKCDYCKNILVFKDFICTIVRKNHDDIKYCKKCIKKGAWRKNYTEEEVKQRGKKITKSKEKFYQTPKGKEIAQQIGKKNSVNTTNFANSEKGKKVRKRAAKKSSKTMREKILSGEITPNTNNRRTHRDIIYNNIKYRSSWEVAFHSINQEFQYEKLRIKYKFKGKEHIYIVDFINYEKKCVVEIKPKELLKDLQTKAKLKYLNEWCDINGFNLIIYSQKELLEDFAKIPLHLFDEKTKKKLETLKYYHEYSQN